MNYKQLSSSLKKRRYTWLLICAFMMIVLVSGILFLNKSNRENFDDSEVEICSSIIRSGDIVFRKGRSMVSRVVLFSDKESSYSHVGIVFCENKSIYVIHTTPDESQGDIDFVKKESLADFFSPEKASKGSVYRLKKELDTFATPASQFANSFFEQKIVFDNSFDLESENKMYCTELVWKAYRKVGIDLIQGGIETISLPFVNADIVMPSSLMNSNFLEEIYFF